MNSEEHKDVIGWALSERHARLENELDGLRAYRTQCAEFGVLDEEIEFKIEYVQDELDVLNDRLM